MELEEGDVEMISEWPVTSSADQDKKSSEVHVIMDRTYQQSLLLNCAIKGEPNSDVIRTGMQWYESASTSNFCRQADYNKDIFCEVAAKLPKISDSEEHDIFTSKEHIKVSNASDSMDTSTNLKRVASSTAQISLTSLCKQSWFEPSFKTHKNSPGHYKKMLKNTTSCRFQSLELLALPKLGRWWRQEGYKLVQKKESLPCTTNPNTLLYHVARLPEGQAFLKGERHAIKARLEQGDTKAGSLAALGSIEDLLGNPKEAIHYLTFALKQEPHNMEWQWVLHKAQRQQKVQQSQAELFLKIPSEPVFPQMLPVEKVSCKDLGFVEFFYKYAMQRRPVIITDMVDSMTKVPWDLQHIRDIAGDCEARVKRPVSGSVEWAGLEDSQPLKVAQYLDNLHSHTDYLFDWSLPLHCPRLAEELIIPRYFAGDFLQRSSQGSLYKDSWPSLFVAPPGVQGSLHVDAFASHFWMAVFQGRKRWIFFPEEDVPCLYPVYVHSLDPSFEAKITDPDLKTHPLLSLVHPTECVLNAGEIIFVPGGCPHYVQNIDTTLAISANFADLSNFRKVISELQVNALLDPRAADLLKQFRHPRFLSAMRSNIGDLPWTEFKSWQATDVDEFDICEDDLAERRE